MLKIDFLKAYIMGLQEDINFLVDKLEEDYDTNYSDMKRDPKEVIKEIESKLSEI